MHSLLFWAPRYSLHFPRADKTLYLPPRTLPLLPRTHADFILYMLPCVRQRPATGILPLPPTTHMLHRFAYSTYRCNAHLLASPARAHRTASLAFNEGMTLQCGYIPAQALPACCCYRCPYATRMLYATWRMLSAAGCTWNKITAAGWFRSP